VNKDAQVSTLSKLRPLPAMKRRLWQSFLCIALLGIATGLMALGAINQQAQEFSTNQQSQLEFQQLSRDSLLQQLGFENLARDWNTLPPNSRVKLIDEMQKRQTTLLGNLLEQQIVERDMAIRVKQGLDSLQPGKERVPVLRGLAELSRDLAIRISSLHVAQSQKILAEVEKRRWQLNMTVMFLSLFFILLTQYLAWSLLGRHFIRPLLDVSRQLQVISSHGNEPAPPIPQVNQELRDMSDNLRHIQRQLSGQKRNPDVDPTTGLASRSALNQHLQQEWLRGLRREEPVSMLLLSPDPICLQNGHELAEVPEASLQQLVAIATQHTSRVQDFLARFEGNKLAIVLSCTDLEQAIKLAHQLCHRVNQARIATPLLASQPWLTVSVGVANQVPRRPHSWDCLPLEAEEALLQARAQGGNQATVAPCMLPDATWLQAAGNS
jgi:diguanylate cyclase (GGDEF)-like protein